MADPLVHDLVQRIVCLNDAWHGLRELSSDEDPTEPSLSALGDLKALLQARLLQAGHARLVWDRSPALPEPCFSVRLAEPVDGRRDACHMPERVARRLFSDRELASYVRDA